LRTIAESAARSPRREWCRVGAFSLGGCQVAGEARGACVYVSVGDGTPRPGDRVSSWTVPVEELARSMAQRFVRNANRFRGRVKWVERRGVHDWASWRHDLQALIRWGLFRRVKPRPTHWTYKTVAQRSKAFGLRLRFKQPPEELIVFRRNGDRLSGRGSGKVRIKTPGGRKRIVSLPFTVGLRDTTGSLHGRGG
jgi:hypothetical protein